MYLCCKFAVSERCHRLNFYLSFELKAANFEGAVEHYTKCIEALQSEGKGLSELALKAHSNRAACYKQISNFDGTIEGEFT